MALSDTGSTSPRVSQPVPREVRRTAAVKVAVHASGRRSPSRSEARRSVPVTSSGFTTLRVKLAVTGRATPRPAGRNRSSRVLPPRLRLVVLR